MSTEIRPVMVKQNSRYGNFETRHGLDEVWFNNQRVGYRPSDEKDPNHKVLHPLADFPKELVPRVLSGSNGQLTRSLSVPKSPEPEPETLAELEE